MTAADISMDKNTVIKILALDLEFSNSKIADQKLSFFKKILIVKKTQGDSNSWSTDP